MRRSDLTRAGLGARVRRSVYRTGAGCRGLPGAGGWGEAYILGRSARAFGLFAGCVGLRYYGLTRPGIRTLHAAGRCQWPTVVKRACPVRWISWPSPITRNGSISCTYVPTRWPAMMSYCEISDHQKYASYRRRSVRKLRFANDHQGPARAHRALPGAPGALCFDPSQPMAAHPGSGQRGQ